MSLAKRLSNHFSACRLVGLAKHHSASEFPDRDQNGPYIIMQSGYEPGDPAMRPAEYVLGKSGAWLGTHWFIRLPVEERRKEFLFGTKVEVVTLMDSLSSKVKVISEKPDCIDDDAEVDEELKEITEEDA
ncbi:hypothetical protein ACFQY0_03565 [Haloferula chungangensis]|uniref:Uncharacterized protein n=1 Tax=Haloferula chungangensis TaxID=1048331 RepID=A0ABW2L1Q7_9BACT